MRGQAAQLYVREVMPANSGNKPAVLFVHGAGPPAEVSFDSRMEDYSWMRQVARAGFDVTYLAPRDPGSFVPGEWEEQFRKIALETPDEVAYPMP